jgi:serine phosphatase RsbU (regulator of sigma subunit)
MPTNSSSTTAKRYREDVPNMIQEKIDLLCDQERHIATLEAHLDKLRSQRERLEKELEPYHIHTHSGPVQAVAATLTQDTRCLIHRLPNELLH